MQFLKNSPQHPESQKSLDTTLLEAPTADRSQESSPDHWQESLRPKTEQRSPRTPEPTTWRTLGKLGLWVLFWLILSDVGINRLFAYPDGSERDPSSLERYFDYGRSIEGKLNRMVADTVDSSDPIVASGWIDPQDWRSLPSVPKDNDDVLLAYYGMSFSNDISLALAELDGNITLRGIGGPSAPPNHSYAAFIADEFGRENADVVMIGVLTSSVKRMRSLSGLSWNYEHPSPYSYPYYQLNLAGELVAVEPAISSGADFVTEFALNGEPWQQLKAQMADYDVAFDPVVFNTNWADNSALLRLIRRGWANRIRQRSDRGLYDADTGFNPQAPEIETLKVMLSEFAAKARDAEQLPIILLISDSGYGDSLYKVLSPHLQTLDALSLSTHALVPSNNPDNFISDGHFTPAANRDVAEVLHDMIADANLLDE